MTARDSDVTETYKPEYTPMCVSQAFAAASPCVLHERHRFSDGAAACIKCGRSLEDIVTACVAVVQPLDTVTIGKERRELVTYSDRPAMVSWFCETWRKAVAAHMLGGDP